MALPHAAASQHRDDIDGLRAIAVVLVVLFHYRVPGFDGGFVGVDIFFVISGFLIGGIIDRELEAGRFSFIHFYERRVRRIFPALFAMLFAAAAAASVLLFPADFERFAQSATAAATFWSNIHFLNAAGYWDVAATFKPLLHTWSLAVEEQYYLVFPLMLFLIRRWSRSLRLAALGVMLLASFAASVWAVKAEPTAAFYLAPYRFWEFLMGAGLAVWASGEGMLAHAVLDGRVKPGHDVKELLWRSGPTLLSLAGLVMIGIAATTLTRGAAFPGWAAVLPCLGTALLIAAGTMPDNAMSRLLALRPVVFVGLISYSLYLWHWPVYVFARFALFRDPTAWEAGACAALTFALSALSWRYVEQPFRRKGAVARRPLFASGAAAMAAICVFGALVLETDGMAERFNPRLARIVAQESIKGPVKPRCFGVKPEDVSTDRLCSIGAPQTAASFILWGDSHAEAIIPPVADIARRNGRSGLFAGSPSCAPLIGVDRYDVPACRAFNDRILKLVLAHKEITTVILMARWGKNAEGTAFGEEGNGFVPIGDDMGRARKPFDNAAIFARGLNRTVEALRAAGRQVVLVGPVPEIGFTVPQVLARLELEHKEAVVAPPAEVFYKREASVLPLFHSIAQEDGVTAVFPDTYLCTSGRCAVREDGIPLYRDAHHLSDYGARKLEPLLATVIEPLFTRVS